jgi:type IV pilus assembly protein PilO
VDISLTKLPWHAQIGAFVALAVGGCVAFYYYLEAPLRDDMAARQSQLVALRADISKGVATARKLPEFKEQVAQLEARLDGLKAVLPEEKDASDLLRRLQVEASRSNLTIKSFKPSPIVTKQLHAEWPIALELDGTFHNLATFLDRVGHFTRIINITGLDVKGKEKPEGSTTITATCVATTFVLLDKPSKQGAKPATKGA